MNAMLLEIGRRAVEDALVEWRDSGLSELGRNNGLVIKSKYGEPSSIIRLGPEHGLRVGLKAMIQAIEDEEDSHYDMWMALKGAVSSET